MTDINLYPTSWQHTIPNYSSCNIIRTSLFANYSANMSHRVTGFHTRLKNYLCDLFQQEFYLYLDWYSNGTRKADFQLGFPVLGPFLEKVDTIKIWKNFLLKYVDTTQENWYLTFHGNLNRSRYSKVQKGQKNLNVTQVNRNTLQKVSVVYD